VARHFSNGAFCSEVDSRVSFYMQQLVHRQLPAGATIVRQGDVGEEFFVILRGVVAVMVRDSNSVENQVAELTEGCSFGELALLEENSKRRATCICKETCSFAVIHKTVFDECAADLFNNTVLQPRPDLHAYVRGCTT
jgi:CRP-like cAMP-binding protein